MIEYIIKVDNSKKDIMGNSPLIEPPIELVRCKDCKHAEIGTDRHGEQYVECQYHYEEGYDPEPPHALNWFCADGEKKNSKNLPETSNEDGEQNDRKESETI